MLKKLSFIFGLALAGFIFNPTQLVKAKDFTTPHTLQPGDILSADVLNEMFELIETTSGAVTSSDLVGTWTCSAVASTATTPAFGRCPSWSLSGNALFNSISNSTIEFIDNGGGSYSLTSGNPNPFVWVQVESTGDSSCRAFTTAYEVRDNILWVQDTGADYVTDLPVRYRLKSYGSNRFNMFNMGYEGSDWHPNSITCDKQDLPPSNATTHSATSSGLAITLSWTDNSSDEAGFKVMRRDSLAGSWATITTTAAGATSYTDTVSSAGTYWYRIKATNGNGDSLGSNVIKITVSN